MTSFVFWVCVIAACGYISYQSAFALIEIPALEDEDEVPSSIDTLGVNDSSPDMIATKMKFDGEKSKFSNLVSYNLEDYAFVVSNNSRICPEHNCKFELEDVTLYSKGDGLQGTIKVDKGDVKKIFGIYSRFKATEEREEKGQTITTVEGTFRVGKEPVNNAEYQYNVNGTLATDGNDRILSLQGVQCTGVNLSDFTTPSDCNY